MNLIAPPTISGVVTARNGAVVPVSATGGASATAPDVIRDLLALGFTPDPTGITAPPFALDFTRKGASAFAPLLCL